MDKRHRKFFYAFLVFNCFLSPACNHEKHIGLIFNHHTKPVKNTVIKAGN